MKNASPRVFTFEEQQISRKPFIDDELHQALALGTGDLLRTSLNVYVSYISTEIDKIIISEDGEKLFRSIIDKPSSGFTSRNSLKRILLSTLAQDIMYIIWRESESIRDEALAEAGLCRTFGENGKYLTRNSLKNLICDDRSHLSAGDGDALKRSIDRICDALEIYGLIERQFIRTNLKPFHGTYRLHILISSAHMEVSQIFARQLQDDEGAQDE